MLLPSLVRLSALVVDDERLTQAWVRGVADAWRASGRCDGLWMWLDDSCDPPELSVWAPDEPVREAVAA